MRFVDVPPSRAIGGMLAHSCRLDGRRIAKGTPLDAALSARLDAAGVERVSVALPERGDVPEDEAARRVAMTFAAEGLGTGRASTGRVNVYADRAGLFLFDRSAVVAANSIDERVTLATLAENMLVAADRLVATVKIIPFAVPEAVLQRVCGALRPARLMPRRPKRAVLVQTTLPHLSERALAKTRRVTEARLRERGATLLAEVRCAHEVKALCEALREAATHAASWVLVVGASAICDRRDVVPRAIERSGGRVERFGLPVDPGNLMLIGRLGSRHVLGLPGCARSPKDNGLDRVLDRLACDAPLERAWLDGLSIGGVLEETDARGLRREDIERKS